MSVIVQLIGGLGNQMFQYANGRAVASRLNIPLKLDITSFEHYKLREYKLGHFLIQESFASPEEIAFYTSNVRNKSLVSRIKRKITPWHKRRKIQERKFSYDRGILSVSDSCYLAGYWQSERYFSEIRDTIKKEFTLKNPPDRNYQQFIDKIKDDNSVSIHIRRGDYLNNPEARKFHGVLSIEYYRKAISQISKNVRNPVFYVFSDDISWARENLKWLTPVNFIDFNGPENDIQDLNLMKNCTHHIIANSSFSWWGAWLSHCDLSSNLVVVPSMWFSKEDKTEKDTRDLIPDNWIRL